MTASRRDFLTGTLGGWLANQVAPERGRIEGRIVGASHAVGHLLVQGGPSASPVSTETCDVLVVGGGISGLSAAWRLGHESLDVRVIDLEPFLGGTSTWGEEGVVPHPWGAHYLPAPNLEARAALRLLEEMGTLLRYDAAGRPVFDPVRLCHAPQERLFYKGAWHSGLAPRDALDDTEEAELSRFEALMDELQDKRGADGRYLFQIPVELSSRDPENLALDRMTFANWLEANGFRSPFVRWYARYATLDDFGAEPENVSAWAGIHYFTSRKQESEALAGSRFLVWPEGNGRLAHALHAASGARFTAGMLAVLVQETDAGVEVKVIDVENKVVRTIRSRATVLATPAFVARRIFPQAASLLPVRTASPWLVANLHVTRPLDPNQAWDSVLFEADGLGYVDAAHQLTPPSDRTVLTYFRAFGASDVARSRKDLLESSWERLTTSVLRDLGRAHPDLRQHTSRVDLMLWGHAMPRPETGFLGASPFAPTRRIGRRVTFGHVDLAGMALFEEAQRAGVLAAEAALGVLGLNARESWA